jgi:hypothetical protein
MVEGQQFRIRRGCLAHRRTPDHDPPRHALDKMGRLHPPAQSRIGEVVAKGIEARVEAHRAAVLL